MRERCASARSRAATRSSSVRTCSARASAACVNCSRASASWVCSAAADRLAIGPRQVARQLVEAGDQPSRVRFQLDDRSERDVHVAPDLLRALVENPLQLDARGEQSAHRLLRFGNGDGVDVRDRRRRLLTPPDQIPRDQRRIRDSAQHRERHRLQRCRRDRSAARHHQVERARRRASDFSNVDNARQCYLVILGGPGGSELHPGGGARAPDRRMVGVRKGVVS